MAVHEMKKSQPLRTNALSHTQQILLGIFLPLPIFALIELIPYPSWESISGALIGLQILTYFFLKMDKKRAQAEQWRIPESTLHLLEVLGGWPASFIAQHRFRHKIAKRRYQLTFWFIVILHQLSALTYLTENTRLLSQALLHF